MRFGLRDLSDTEIARRPDFDARVQEEARGEDAGYNAADHDWSPEPPNDGTCRTCYIWKRYPPGQRHFGWSWWRICPPECTCSHHAGEVWYA